MGTIRSEEEHAEGDDVQRPSDEVGLDSEGEGTTVGRLWGGTEGG